MLTVNQTVISGDVTIVIQVRECIEVGNMIYVPPNFDNLIEVYGFE